MSKMKNKIVFITGASSGMGVFISSKFRLRWVAAFSFSTAFACVGIAISLIF